LKKLVFILCLLCSPAWAADDLKRGEGLFSRMQYDEAMQMAEAALTSARADRPGLVRAYRLKGLCQAALNQPREAVKTFRRLLSIDSTFRLEKGLSPKYTAPFYQAVALSEETGYLKLKNHSPKTRRPADEPGLKLELVSDPMELVEAVRLNFWTGKRDPLKIRRAVEGPGVIDIPLPFARRAGDIRYYFEALNHYGGVVARLGNRDKPFRLRTRTKDAPLAVVVPPPVAPLPVDPDPPAVTDSDDDRWYASWWFWTIVGVVAAGTATGVTLAVMSDTGGGNDYQVTWEYR